MWLESVASAGANAADWAAGFTADDYARNSLNRDAVARQVVVIGNALGRIGRIDPETVARIPAHRQAIGLGNDLIEHYDTVDHDRVRVLAQEYLPEMLSSVRVLLAEAESEFGDG